MKWKFRNDKGRMLSAPTELAGRTRIGHPTHYETGLYEENMMKPKWTVWVTILAALLTVPAVHGWSYNPEIFTLVGGNADGAEIRTAGNFVVWRDMTGMQWHGYDLAARESFLLTGGNAMSMTINESYAVWQDDMAMTWYGYDLAARKKTALPLTDIDGMSVQLTGRFLIFRSMMDMVLRGMDLESGEIFAITSDEIDGTSVRVAGDTVIWTTMTGPMSLAGYDLSARQGFVLSDGDIDSMSVAMGDRFVAWKQNATPDPTGGLYCFDLAKREKTLITTEDIDSTSLRVGGQFIVGRHMMSGILYGFDGISHEIFQISLTNIDSMGLKVNDRYGIWQDAMNMRLNGYDLVERRPIDIEMVIDGEPVLSGSYLFAVAYDMDRGYELRGFDLAQNENFFVSKISETIPPRGQGEYVVWIDTDPMNSGSALYGARIWKLPNDKCEDAVEVTAGTAYAGDSSGALGTDLTPDCGDYDWRDAWFAFRPAVGGEYTIDAHSDAFDTTLAAFATCTGAATACNDDANIQTIDSRLVMTLVKGKRYLFRVAGFDGGSGPYTFTVSRGSCKTPPTADLNGDCKVNMPDLAAFSSQWLRCGLEPAELCKP
jgi:hypothetical protein